MATTTTATTTATTAMASGGTLRGRAGNTAMVGTLVFVGAGAMFMVGLCAIYMVMHRLQGADFVPKEMKFTQYIGATAAVTAIIGSFAVEWAMASVKMGHRRYAAMGWGLAAMMGLALANAIWYAGVQVRQPIEGSSGYAVGVYALLAGAMALVIVGTVATALAFARTAADHVSAAQPHLGRAAAWLWHLGALAFLAAYGLIWLYK